MTSETADGCSAAQQQHVNVLVMTYHFPGFPPVEEFVNMANECHVPLVRNDVVFSALMQTPDVQLNDYVLHDHWHPNAKGYRIIAENALDGIIQHHLLGDETHVSVEHSHVPQHPF